MLKTNLRADRWLRITNNGADTLACTVLINSPRSGRGGVSVEITAPQVIVIERDVYDEMAGILTISIQAGERLMVFLPPGESGMLGVTPGHGTPRVTCRGPQSVRFVREAILKAPELRIMRRTQAVMAAEAKAAKEA